MSLAELKEVLSGPCRRHPVRSLRVFGSVARGENTMSSFIHAADLHIDGPMRRLP